MPLVFACAASHTPGIRAWADAAPAEQRERFFAGFEQLGEQLRSARPDAILIVTSEHFANYFLDGMPAFTLGQGPALDYWEISRPQWLSGGNLVHLVHIGPADPERAPGVPHLSELVSTDRDRALVEFLEIGANLGWPLLAPPGIPAQRAAALQQAFAQLVQDAEFAAAVQATMRARLNPTVGPDLATFVIEALQTPPAIVAEAKAILGLNR